MRFEEDGAAPIVIDSAGTDAYAAQVEEQMAAAAAMVSKPFTQAKIPPPLLYALLLSRRLQLADYLAIQLLSKACTATLDP